SKAPSAPVQSVTKDRVVKVRATDGIGIDVELETYDTTSKGHVTLTSSAPTAEAASSWVLPGVIQNASTDSGVSITDAGTSPVSVIVEQVYGTPISVSGSPAGGSEAPVRLTTVEVNPGTSVLVALGTLVTPATTAQFGLEIEASGPVLVTANIWPAKKIAAAATESGVPATSG
ncbi:MAG: hypothetical protein ACLPYW_08695, partial [Acidimicrobiales bacterium]